MQRLLFFLLIVSVFFHPKAAAQEKDPRPEYRKIGFTYTSWGENDVLRSEELIGAAGISGDTFYAIGITFIQPVNRWIEAETGIEYAKHHIFIHPNVPPDEDSSIKEASFSLINIPVTFRLNFLRFFFINAGALIDIDASTTHVIDSQAGIGAMLGAAVKYDASFGLSIFLNPYTRYHSLIPFSQGSYHQRVYDSGIRVGMTYTLDRKPRSSQSP